MFSADKQGQWIVVRLSGELDLAVVDEFRATVRHALTGADRVAIDFSEVTFMDSTGLAVIAATAKQTKFQGGQLVLVGLTRPTRLVLEITGMTEVLDIRDALPGDEDSVLS